MVNKFLIKFFLLFAFANLSIQFSAAMESDNKQVNVPNLNAINAVELPVINAENPNISYMFMERFLARHSEYSSGKVFVFDTETTGATYEDKIIQITILEFLCGKFTGRIFNRYFNPARDSSILAYKAHGISASELAQESTFGEVFPHIRAFLGENPTMLAYNSPFDARMLKAEIERMPHDDSVEVVTFDFFHKDIRQILQRDLKRFLTGFKVESPEKKQVRCKQKSAADLLLERESRLLNNTVSYIDGAIKSNSRDSQLPWGNQVAFIESVRKDIDQATLRKNSPLWLSRYHQEIDIYDKISESLVRDRRISEENNIKKLKEFEKKAFWSKKRLKRLTARMSSLSRHISEKKLNKNSSEYKDYLAKIKKYKSVVFGLGQVIKGVRSNKIQFKNKMITHIASIDGLQRKLAKLRQSIARGKRACGEQIRGSFLARLNGAAEQVVVANPQVQAVAKPISVLVKRKAIGADLVVPVHGIENNLLLGNGANHKKAKKRRVIPSLGKVADILGISFEQTSEDVMSLASHPESRPSKRPGTAHDAVADTAVTLRVMNSLYKDPYKVARKISAALGWGD